MAAAWHSPNSEHKAHDKQHRNLGEEVGEHFRGNKTEKQSRRAGGTSQETQKRLKAERQRLMPADVSVRINT